jgi:SulP family sulfate permease
MRREILGQGVANVAGAFASSFPASASLTRSALLKLGGASSRVAAAVAAIAVIPILLFGGTLVAAMPQASLAGVLFVTAAGMVDVSRIRRMWVAAKVTRYLLVVTMVATLVLPLEWAIFIGVGLGVAQHLASGRSPRLTLLAPGDGRLVPIRPEEAGPVVILEVSGDCHFAAATAFVARAEEALPERVEHVIVDLSHTHALRFAALMAFERLSEAVRARGGTLLLAGVEPDFCELLDQTQSELQAVPYEAEPLASVETALRIVTGQDQGDSVAA